MHNNVYLCTPVILESIICLKIAEHDIGFIYHTTELTIGSRGLYGRTFAAGCDQRQGGDETCSHSCCRVRLACQPQGIAVHVADAVFFFFL